MDRGELEGRQGKAGGTGGRTVVGMKNKEKNYERKKIKKDKNLNK